MTITAIVCASFLCLGVVAAAQEGSKAVFACNLKAISAAERPHYTALMKRIRAAAHDRREVQNGYAYRLNEKAVSLPEVAEWIAMERLCCPFLTLQISAAGSQVDWVLTLTGPEGVKTLLNEEFPTIAR
jgi:hypothetical protein